MYAGSIQLRSAGCSAVRLHPKPTTQRGTGSREETHTLNLFDLNYMPPLRIYLVIVVSLMSSNLYAYEPDVQGAKGLLGKLWSTLRMVVVFWSICNVIHFGVHLTTRGRSMARGTLSWLLRKVWDKRDDWRIALGLIICVRFRFGRTFICRQGYGESSFYRTLRMYTWLHEVEPWSVGSSKLAHFDMI